MAHMSCFAQHAFRCGWTEQLESGKFFRNEDIPIAIQRLVNPNDTDEFCLRHYDATRFGYQERPPVVVSDGEDDDGDDRRNRSRNKDPRKSARIESGTAVKN